MTTAGILGSIVDTGQVAGHCLVIGRGVPRKHMAYTGPTYLVAEHPRGASIRCKDGKVRRLLAYPSSWCGPGEAVPDRWIRARHEFLLWFDDVPLFDGESTI